MLLKEVLAQAAAAGFNFVAYYDAGEVDYRGEDPVKCLEALEACDEMHLKIYDGQRRIGWLFVVNDANGDPEEQIADCSDTHWFRKIGLVED